MLSSRWVLKVLKRRSIIFLSCYFYSSGLFEKNFFLVTPSRRQVICDGKNEDWSSDRECNEELRKKLN